MRRNNNDEILYFGRNQPDFIAELQYRKTEEGGRKTRASSGYRPAVKFDFARMQTSGEQIFIDKESVSPRETVLAELTLLVPSLYPNCLSVGMHFQFREGDHVIGTGEIKQILNKDLEKK